LLCPNQQPRRPPNAPCQGGHSSNAEGVWSTVLARERSVEGVVTMPYSASSVLPSCDSRGRSPKWCKDAPGRGRCWGEADNTKACALRRRLPNAYEASPMETFGAGPARREGQLSTVIGDRRARPAPVGNSLQSSKGFRGRRGGDETGLGHGPVILAARAEPDRSSWTRGDGLRRPVGTGQRLRGSGPLRRHHLVDGRGADLVRLAVNPWDRLTGRVRQGPDTDAATNWERGGTGRAVARTLGALRVRAADGVP
jgi:hypothetical protein